MASESLEYQYKYCPQCASSNSELGSVPFKCQSCGFANFFGPVAAVGGLVVNEAQELLLVRRARDPGKGKWGLPGGFVDRDETIEAALIREIQEETGLTVLETRYLLSHPNTYVYHGVAAPVIDLFYICRVNAISTIELAREELEHFEWARPTPQHLDNMAFHSNRVAIEFWLKQKT